MANMTYSARMPRLVSEWWRQGIAALAATPMFFVPVDLLFTVMLLWNVFAMVYLLLTWLVFRKADSRQIFRIGEKLRPSRAQRAILGGPDSLAEGAATVGFVVAALGLPQAGNIGPPILVVVSGVVAVVGSWFTIHVSCALHYLIIYVEDGGLEFAGESEPVFLDFTYFAFGIGTTIGAGDVTVTGRRVRRAVQVHGLVSFFFNTLILALVIGVLTPYLAMLGR